MFIWNFLSSLGGVVLLPAQYAIWAILQLMWQLLKAVGAETLQQEVFGYGPKGSMYGMFGSGLTTVVAGKTVPDLAWWTIFQWAVWVGMGIAGIWLIWELMRLGMDFAASGSNPQARVSLRETATNLAWVAFGLIFYWFILNAIFKVDQGIAQLFGKWAGITNPYEGLTQLDLYTGQGSPTLGGMFAADIVSVAQMYFYALFTVWYYFRTFAVMLLAAMGPTIGVVMAVRPANRKLVATFWREFLLLVFTQDIQAAFWMLILLAEKSMVRSYSVSATTGQLTQCGGLALARGLCHPATAGATHSMVYGIPLQSALVLIAGMAAIWPMTNLIRTIFGAGHDNAVLPMAAVSAGLMAAAGGLAASAVEGGGGAAGALRGASLGGGIGNAVQTATGAGAGGAARAAYSTASRVAGVVGPQASAASAMTLAARGRLDPAAGLRVRQAVGQAAGSALGALFGTGMALAGGNFETGRRVGQALGHHTIGGVAGAAAGARHYASARGAAEQALRSSTDPGVRDVLDRMAQGDKAAKQEFKAYRAAHMAGIDLGRAKEMSQAFKNPAAFEADMTRIARQTHAATLAYGAFGASGGSAVAAMAGGFRPAHVMSHVTDPRARETLANLQDGDQVRFLMTPHYTAVQAAQGDSLEFDTIGMSGHHLGPGYAADAEVSENFEVWRVPSNWQQIDDERLRAQMANRMRDGIFLDFAGDTNDRIYLHPQATLHRTPNPDRPDIGYGFGAFLHDNQAAF